MQSEPDEKNAEMRKKNAILNLTQKIRRYPDSGQGNGHKKICKVPNQSKIQQKNNIAKYGLFP